MSTAPPPPVGTTGAMAARRMPRMRLTISVAADNSAPVLPAETKAAPSPFFSRFRPTVREESFLRLKAVAGSSHISTTSVAFTISTPSGRGPVRQARMASSRPTSTMSAPHWAWASKAPCTTA